MTLSSSSIEDLHWWAVSLPSALDITKPRNSETKQRNETAKRNSETTRFILFLVKGITTFKSN
jgi:hypothetical protein